MVHGKLVDTLLWLIGRRLRYRVRGDSMRPSYGPGDIIFASPVSRGDVRAGDVVLFKHPFKPVHAIKRVSAVVEDERLDVRGDNALESSDSRSFGPIRPEAVLGIVRKRTNTSQAKAGVQ